MDLKDSKTKENLMRAFAGESQARNRYTFAAELAQKNNLYVIKKVFDLTASQEKEHGEVFYKYLRSIEGESITIAAGYPVNTSEDVLKQLEYGVHNEMEEAEDVYKAFGDKALEEGFNQIAGKFYLIADIERKHGERFETFAKLMRDGNLFVSEVETGWMCLHCGYVVYAANAPENCPVCDSDQGYFVRLSMAPYVTPSMEKQERSTDLGKKG